MRKVLIGLGLILILAGGGLAASSIIFQPPARDALPVVQGTVLEMWRFQQRRGTDMRVQVAAPGREPQTFWIPIAQVTPGMLNGVRGRNATLRHMPNGEIMELIVEGRPVLDYAVAANKRSGSLMTNRWVGFGIFMGGVALTAIGLALFI